MAPFHHLSEDSHINCRSEQGQLRHLVNDYRSKSLPDHCFGTAYHLIDDAGGAHQLLGLTDQFAGQQAHLFEVTGKLWSWRKSTKSLHGKLLSIKTSLTNHWKLPSPQATL